MAKVLVGPINTLESTRTDSTKVEIIKKSAIAEMQGLQKQILRYESEYSGFCEGLRKVLKGASNELFATRTRLKQAEGLLEETKADVNRLIDLLQVQLDRLEGKKPPEDYILGVDPNADHVFGPVRPAHKGMNHTASEYSVCIKCGRSDVNLKEEGMPLCRL